MHETAEFGIAAHWRYKEGQRTARRDREYEAKVANLRRQMDWRHDIEDAQEFVDSLQSDIFQDYIYVYTPRGDIIELPAGATPIDFAFRIHTELATSARARRPTARYHDRHAAQERRYGQDHQGPPPPRPELRLDLQRTPLRHHGQCASEDRERFRKQAREQNISEGRDILEAELKRLGMADHRKPSCWRCSHATTPSTSCWKPSATPM